MNKYFKNFILCGDIDHYCLLCQEKFQLIPDIEKHIRWEQHRRNIKAQDYLPKFKKEFVYKVRNNYYCEICNFVASNMATLTDHTRTEKHRAAKIDPKTITKQPVGLHDSGYVIIGKVILNKRQWNCIVDNKCLLCNVDVTDIDEHIGLQDHIIKLIQCETRYQADGHYRVINGNSYQCYTCKKIFPNYEIFTKHSEKSKCDSNDDIKIKKLKAGSTSRNDTTAGTDDAYQMLDVEKKLIETLEDLFYIDEKNNNAACKHCAALLKVNFKDMIEHMKNVHDKPTKLKTNADSSSESSEDEVVYREVTDCGKRRAELAKYGKEHSIKMNYNGSKGYCNICNRYLSAHKRIFREHVRGALHRNHLELKGVKKPKEHETCPLKTQPMNSNTVTIHFSPEMEGFWIDGEFWITVNSFFLLYPIENDPHYRKTKCFACDELIPREKEAEHCATTKHKNNFSAVKLVIIKGEFMREIRPNLYHCGFCNQVMPFWETVVKHGLSFNHTFVREDKNVTSNALDYWCNFAPTSIPMKAKSYNNFYLQLMRHVFGYKEIR